MQRRQAMRRFAFAFATAVLPVLLHAQTANTPQEQTPAQTPLNPAQTPLTHVREQIAQRNLPGAESELRTLLSNKQVGAQAHSLLGYVLFLENKFTGSLAEYTEAARWQTPSPDDLIVVATDYIQLHDYPDAERWLRYVAEHAPANQTAWYLLGRTQYRQDHPAEAVQSFQHCLALHPRDLRAQYNLGLALERTQQPAAAIEAYRRAIEWEQAGSLHDPQPYLDLGILLLAQGQKQEALTLLQEAAKRGPGNATVQQQLGICLEAVGHDEEAIHAFERAIALAPNADRPHYFLGRLLHRLGRSQESAAQFAIVSRLLAAHSNTETPNLDTATLPPPIEGGSPK